MTRRFAEGLFTACAIGEIAAGLSVALLPATVMGFLLGASLEPTGTIAARVAGVALLALGLAWWPDRHRRDRRQRRHVAPGFVVYNVGVGALLASYAATAGSAVPQTWIVAAAHLLAGGTFAVLASRPED